jgi:hypothetical protein
MKERPILFNGEMVRAILAGQKTQTRRIPPKTQQDALFCPYGHPGDRLWVRERWAADMSFDDLPPRMLQPRGMPIYYHATTQCMDYKWRPSIHMPRWASRITLEITDIRVERVQDISEEDVQAEGFSDRPASKNKFRIAWDLLYWKRGLGWDVNPWVWVVTFKRAEEVCQKN